VQQPAVPQQHEHAEFEREHFEQRDFYFNDQQHNPEHDIYSATERHA
jgi:hypothetical protein